MSGGDGEMVKVVKMLNEDNSWSIRLVVMKIISNDTPGDYDTIFLLILIWIKVGFPDFPYYALNLLVSANSLAHWSSIKCTRPPILICIRNVDDSSKGKPGYVGIGGAILDHIGIVMGFS
ncbi:hypothetical protein SADUNF_Sadunf05G0070300 [Salix dunnii]|uniref:Uncharacterized protein n=1 Tax=Salix dunnii TaxID=1413687 RepID=A0A835MX32_9ROSI|nr:hypothetical protein SADUNF_Sadunf05G0070300 [Salix dunnii]